MRSTERPRHLDEASARVCVACGCKSLIDSRPAITYGSPSAAQQERARQFMRCPACGLGQRLRRPSAEELADMYAATPVEAMDYDYEANAAWARTRAFLRSRFGESAPITVLDVGCHTGQFLGGLPNAWTKLGIEMGTETGRVAAEKQAVTIISQSLRDAPAHRRGTCDVVTMFDVVEHVSNPLEGLQQAAGLLKPGGLLILSTGNLDAWTWRWLGWNHWYVETEQHLNVLTGAFLRFAGKRLGLDLEELADIPHRKATLSRRCREAIRLVYWGLQLRGGWMRAPQRLLQVLPGQKRLRHMSSVPWSMSLSDHMLARLRLTNGQETSASLVQAKAL